MTQRRSIVGVSQYLGISNKQQARAIIYVGKIACYDATQKLRYGLPSLQSIGCQLDWAM